MPAAIRSAAAAAPAAVAVAVPVRATAPRRSLAEWLGWRRLDGTVVHAGLQQMGRLQKEWWEIAWKVCVIATILLFFGIAALAILVIVAVLSLFFARKQRDRPGFLQNLATQVAAFLIIGRLFGPRKSIPVCDFRIRDANGTESLVRVEGHVIQGAFASGDDVTVEGFNHGGTLVLRRGWNRRLNCAIRVQRR
ncbi:MAG TPA: hypothetical protein VEO54_12630 [Thermoanaerobaculia bacterium]|nr:hypothetical protein [Thermoanaerobaculia bacterium]